MSDKHKYKIHSFKYNVEQNIEHYSDYELKKRLNEVENSVYYRLIIDFLIVIILILVSIISFIYFGNDHPVFGFIGGITFLTMFVVPSRIIDLFNRKWEKNRLEWEIYLRNTNKLNEKSQ